MRCPFPHSIRCRAAALALVAVAAVGLPNTQAAKNPLNVIEAQTFDSKSGDFKTEPASEGGTTLAAIHDGDYAVYKDYDFDSGVAAFKARVSSPRNGSIEIRLDSPTGKLLGTCPFAATHDWHTWADATCNVDNSQAGARDVYLVFHGEPGNKGAVLNLKSFVFLKSVVVADTGTVDLSGRLDQEDNEPQATHAWGMPEAGFTDDLAHGLTHWKTSGFSGAGDGAVADAQAPAWAYTPDVYINKTDTGGGWRTIAEAALSVNVVADAKGSRPGVGFASKDGEQAVYVVLNAGTGALEAWRKLKDGGVMLIRSHPKTAQDTRPATDPKGDWTIQPGTKYRLQVDWSPYSNGLIAFLYDAQGKEITSFRTVIDLPAARRPLLVSSGGPARFDHVKFDPTLDGWNFRWEWLKTPALASDVCNPAVWKHDGKFYMLWRKFGADTFHGIASSDDGVKWTRVIDQTMKCTGDMDVVVDPFGDGKWYVTPGSANQPWYTSDGTDHFKNWTASPLKLGSIFGHNRIQEIVDTKRSPQIKPVSFQGKDYRFIGYTEDWVHSPLPHTVVLLSNTLTDWVEASPDALIPPGNDFWGEKGNAIGSAFVLPDGNLLIASCSCTNEGYTGAPESTNVSAIADGKEPWKLLKKAVLPDAPVSREHVWYEGPNFGTALFYDKDSDTLFYYGGFHDYYVGMMRVRHFLHPEQWQREVTARK